MSDQKIFNEIQGIFTAMEKIKQDEEKLKFEEEKKNGNQKQYHPPQDSKNCKQQLDDFFSFLNMKDQISPQEQEALQELLSTCSNHRDDDPKHQQICKKNDPISWENLKNLFVFQDDEAMEKEKQQLMKAFQTLTKQDEEVDLNSFREQLGIYDKKDKESHEKIIQEIRVWQKQNKTENTQQQPKQKGKQKEMFNFKNYLEDQYKKKN